MKKLYLVDVSSMYFRAFYAIRHLTNKQGMPTNALYGFAAMAIKLLKEVSPDYMAFCFDLKEPTFRKEIYPDYKANRSEMPEELVPQVPYIKKLTNAFGVPAFERKGFEADDLIGTFTKFGRKHNLEVVIVSADKDLAQLVGPFVTMYDTMKETHYDQKGVVEKWGVEPTQIVDYLALVGDSSDNIPGVSGIGPKGAQKLLAEYKTLDNIYKHLDDIKNESLRKKLAADKENAFLSHKLSEIACDVPIDVTLDDLKLKPIPEKELRDLLEELDFKSFERRIFGASEAVTKKEEAPAAPESSQHSAAPAHASALENVQSSFVDMGDVTESEIEPGELQQHFHKHEEVWGVVSDRGVYLGTEKKVFRLRGSLPEFSKALDGLDLRWKGFDLKSLWHALGVDKTHGVWDSALAAYVVRAGEVGTFAETLIKYTGASHPDLANGKQLVESHIRLEQALRNRVKEVHGNRVLEEIDFPLASILYHMERRGILVDAKRLGEQSRGVSEDLRNLEKQIFEMTGHTFNLGSTKQLGDILFNKLKMPVLKKTKTGFSTDSDVLEKLSVEYPVCLLIIEYRELSKLKSTYIDSLPLLINPNTGRIHTHFNQTVTTTGRLSSTNPNLQNIPIRTERGAQIRKAFVVPAGKVLISADYSQIELRILAHISGDANLIEAFKADRDIHAATAAEVFEVDLKAVTSEQRRMAKAVNFGIAYGMSPFGLSENLGIPVEQASDIIKRYFRRFPKVADYMNETVETAKKQGYVETLFGRRRYMDELKSKNGAIRKFGERAAINAPMQGTAADIVKKAMIEVDKMLPGTMLLQVHDELVFEVPKDEADHVIKTAHRVMENVVELRVPLKVNIASGHDWDSAH